MLKSFQKVAVASASAVFSLVATNVNPTQAATVFYDFMVSIDDGPLLGETYEGSFEYDDSSLVGSGAEVAPVSSFAFDFSGINYTETDVPGASVEFSEGSFQGLSLSLGEIPSDAPPAFTFVPGFAGEDPLFAYDSGEVGTGGITYTLGTVNPPNPDPGPTTVPEPATGIALLTLAAFGVIPRLKKRQ
ncbi:MAG: PEP-CTERM sorting domain-containing protein [Cyanobacteria bacterium P01_G01_bin.49]